MQKLYIRVLVIIALCLIITACGKQQKKSSITSKQQELQREFENSKGEYRVVFESINQGVALNNANGTAIIEMAPQEFKVTIKMLEVPRWTEHRQYAYAIERCPTKEDDINQDGIIDLLEATKGVGPIFALDKDMTDLDTESDMPHADGSGSYHYHSSGDLPLMVDMLMQKGVGLNGLKVFILGVPEGTQLPQTVGNGPNMSAAEGMPVSCGNITLVPQEGDNPGL